MTDEAIQAAPGAAIDPLLLRRLMRPIAQPGLIRMRQAYRIVERIETMLPVNTLAERLARRTQLGQAEGVDLPLVVVGRPGVPIQRATAMPAGQTPMLPVTRPLAQPGSLPASARPVEPMPPARPNGEHRPAGTPAVEGLPASFRLVTGHPHSAPANLLPGNSGRTSSAAPGLIQRRALTTGAPHPPFAMPEVQQRGVPHVAIAAVRPEVAPVTGSAQRAVVPGATPQMPAVLAGAITGNRPLDVSPPNSAAALPVVRAEQAPTHAAPQAIYQAPQVVPHPVVPAHAPERPRSAASVTLPIVPAARPAEPAFQHAAPHTGLPLAVPAQVAAARPHVQAAARQEPGVPIGMVNGVHAAARQEPGVPIGTANGVPSAAPPPHQATPAPGLAQQPAPNERAIVRQVERRFRHTLRIEAERRGEPR